MRKLLPCLDFPARELTSYGALGLLDTFPTFSRHVFNGETERALAASPLRKLPSTPLCSLNLLFRDVPVAVAVVVFLNSLLFHIATQHNMEWGNCCLVWTFRRASWRHMALSDFLTRFPPSRVTFSTVKLSAPLRLHRFGSYLAHH